MSEKHTDISLGQIAFEKHIEHNFVSHPRLGMRTATWEELPKNIQGQWQNVADTVVTSARSITEWQPISTAPKDEATSFLVYWENDLNAKVMVQASRFEGYLYPDHLGCAIDYDNRIMDATHWRPLPEPPKENGVLV